MSDAPRIGDSPEGGQTLPCPKCGKPLGPFVTDCPDCRARVVTTDRESLLRKRKYSFGLGDGLLVIGGIAIVLGLYRLEPGVAVGAGVVIFIALIRILGALHRAREWKVRLSTWDVASLIAVSLGVSLVIVISLMVAFFATCLPTGFVAVAALNEAGMVLGLVVGTVVGAATAAFVGRKFIKFLWMAEMPAKLSGIHFLEEMPEKPPVPESPTDKPEPPR